MIKKRQMKFWTSLIRTIDCNSSLGKQTIRISYDNDIDSKLGTYLQVNPDLETPSYDNTFAIEFV